MSLRNLPFLAATLAALAAFAAAAAAAEPAIATTMSAQRRVVEKLPDGKTRVVLETTDRVLPGDQIVYTVSCENRGGEAATDVVVTSPVPTSTTCMPDSAEGEDVRITFSVDQGKTFGALGALVVTTPEGLSRPARATDLTHVRFVRTAPLAAGAAARVQFVAVVN